MQFYGKVGAPWWDDKPVAIVGGGPSLLGFDFEQLRGAHVLAIKGSIFDIAWADAGFGLDMPRYMEWRDKLTYVRSRIYWAVPVEQIDRTGPPPSDNVTFLRRLAGEGISEDSGEIFGGGTSGFGGMQVAFHKRAKEIVLFGFDYDGAFIEANQSGAFRYNDQHYKRRMFQSARNWQEWAGHFATYLPYLEQRGIRVYNACPGSAITCFPQMSLDDGVAMVRDSVGA